ncbi:MAG: 5-formyltetrahydrofolate cyclo-ligase [Proteobacteria bacterium]|nr:5-formyltetrahydrofolate cyclo-ligase [Pseudomonadota bacterium]
MDKSELRGIMRNLVIDQVQLIEQQDYLLKELSKEILLKKPLCVGLFSPLPNEINLNGILPILSTTAAYPRVSGNTLAFHKVTNLDELTPSPPYGICEPYAEAEIVKPDLIIIPGLAFTKEGVRLGRGKGYYDRYLNSDPCFTIGLAFSWQLLPQIPTNHHDVLIDKIITKN